MNKTQEQRGKGCILSDTDKADHLSWCRDFIEHNCIFRSPYNNHLLTSPNGRLNSWQFYMRIATLDQQFGYRLGLLFWDRFLGNFNEEQFQLCGCETGGVPLVCLLQAIGYELGISVNVFSVKKEAKRYGLHNWFEGIVLTDTPVMMVDDITASQQTLVLQADRIQRMTGLSLYNNAFCIASCQFKRQFAHRLRESSFAPNTDLVVFYHLDDFSMTQEQYAAKYEKQAVFRGTLR